MNVQRAIIIETVDQVFAKCLNRCVGACIQLLCAVREPALW